MSMSATTTARARIRARAQATLLHNGTLLPDPTTDEIADEAYYVEAGDCDDNNDNKDGKPVTLAAPCTCTPSHENGNGSVLSFTTSMTMSEPMEDKGQSRCSHESGSDSRNSSSSRTTLTTLRLHLHYPSVDAYETLHPPMSSMEKRRDTLLRCLNSVALRWMGRIVLFLVVADGALFFFFLMGWQTLCDDPSRTNCEPRNRIYNASIHVLTGLFTYMAVLSFPWRVTQACHSFGVCQCPPRPNTPGLNLYGLECHDVWYHIPLVHRRIILTLLIFNCVTQYLNQASRILFYSYALQSTPLGTLFVNLFFALSMFSAFAGGLYMAILSERLRNQHPERFGPGPIQILLTSEFYQRTLSVVPKCCLLCGCGSLSSWSCSSWCCNVRVAQLEVDNQRSDAHVLLWLADPALSSSVSVATYDPTESFSSGGPPPPPPQPHSHSQPRSLAPHGSRSELRMFAL